MWGVSGSPVSLLFGVISPVMVVAHFVDSRRDARRRDARERDEAEAEHPAASKLVELVEVARRPSAVDTDAHQIRLGVTLDGQPFVIASVDGVVVEGVAELTRDVKRSITAQSWWSRMSTSAADEVVTSRAGGGRWLMTVTLAGSASGARLAGELAASVRDRDAPAKSPVPLIPDRMTATELAQLRSGIAEHSRREPLTAESRDGIGVVIGTTVDGDEVALDLVRHGPHAVVSGMTGSGKTSFIVAWLLALADSFSADEVELVVIDFKGGLDFATVADAPHCVGVATDTEAGSIDRALVSLGIEMQRREDALKRGVPVSRLVVVLDEFRATAAAHPLAVPTVVDLTARGRAMGVHVILSTQRAASTISEDILANVPLRVAFRALSVAESRFVVGSDIAHTTLREPGDAIIAGVHEAPVRVQMNPAPSHATSAAIQCGSKSEPAASASARRLWAPPLPFRVSVAEARTHVALGETNFASCIGVADVPALQSWRAVTFDLHADGHLMVTGTAGSGRTTALRTVSLGVPVRWVRDGVELWDLLDARSTARHIGDEPSPQIVIIDGVEGRLGELTPEFRDALVERLTLALRQSAESQPGIKRFVVSCDSDGTWALRFGGLFPNRLDLVAGATIPGRARWRDFDVQVAMHDATEFPAHAPMSVPSPAVCPPTAHAIAVTRTPPQARDAYLASLAKAGLEIIHAASPDEWMRDPAHFATLNVDHDVVIAPDVYSADLRLLARHLAPVPPARPGESLVFAPDGTYRRVG